MHAVVYRIQNAALALNSILPPDNCPLHPVEFFLKMRAILDYSALLTMAPWGQICRQTPHWTQSARSTLVRPKVSSW